MAQWDYTWFTTHDQALVQAMWLAGDRLTALGQQGWEMVNHTMTHTVAPVDSATPGSTGFLVTCFLRRALGQ
jgi:hypothetical protein